MTQVVVVHQGDRRSFDELQEVLQRQTCDSRAGIAALVIRDDGYGAPRARNVGIRVLEERVEWVWAPNDTTRISEETLRAIPMQLESADAACGALACSYDAEGWVRKEVCTGTLEGWALWTALEPAVLWRKRALTDVGGFSEYFGAGSKSIAQSGAGTDLLCRMRAGGWEVAGCPLRFAGLGHASDQDLRKRLKKDFTYGVGFGAIARQYFSISRGSVSVVAPIVKWASGQMVEMRRPGLLEAAATSAGRGLGLALGQRALRTGAPRWLDRYGDSERS